MLTHALSCPAERTVKTDKDSLEGRTQGDWRTHYPEPEARKCIFREAAYVFIQLWMCPVLLTVIYLMPHLAPDLSVSLRLDVVSDFAYAWIAGLLGGTVFAMKWLYQSVARARWHQDRQLWRYLSPHLSAALAFAFVCLVRSGIVVIFDDTSLEDPVAIVAVAFLVGCFSDSAFRKLQDVAEALFGKPTTNSQEDDVKKKEGLE